MRRFPLNIQVLAFALIAYLVGVGCNNEPRRGPTAFSGSWTMDASRSSDLDQWRSVIIELEFKPDSVTIARRFGAGRYNRADSYTIPTNGQSHSIPVENSSKWLDNVHIGVFSRAGSDSAMRFEWNNDQTGFSWTTEQEMQTSTGTANVLTTRQYSLLDAGGSLQVIETRSTRAAPLTFVFQPSA